MKIRDSLFLLLNQKRILVSHIPSFSNLEAEKKILKERQQLSSNKASYPITKQGVRKMFTKKQICGVGKILQAGSFSAM